MKLKLLSAAIAAASLSACMAPPPPVVSSFNGASVEVTTNAMTPQPDGATFNEAGRICSQARKRAEFASTRPGRDSFVHLFLCLDNAQPAMMAAPAGYPMGYPNAQQPQTIIVR